MASFPCTSLPSSILPSNSIGGKHVDDIAANVVAKIPSPPLPASPLGTGWDPANVGDSGRVDRGLVGDIPSVLESSSPSSITAIFPAIILREVVRVVVVVVAISGSSWSDDEWSVDRTISGVTGGVVRLVDTVPSAL